MSAKLHLCGPELLERLDPMVAACHAELGIDASPDSRRAGIAPLLDNSPYGALYLIGPQNAPIGFLAVTFSWSIEFGGLDATLDALWIRPAIRGRGMATEALTALIAALAPTGVRAMSVEADIGSGAAALFGRLGFARRERVVPMRLML